MRAAIAVFVGLHYVAMFSSTVALAAPSETVVVIGRVGWRYSSGSLPSGNSWLGLYCENNECEIKKSNATISSDTEKNVLDEDEAIDVLEPDGLPVALFYGLPIQEGKIETWYKLRDDSEHKSLSYTSLARLGKWSMPWGKSPLTISRTMAPDISQIRYHVANGGAKQFLFATSFEGHYGGDPTPIIHWVGDLDRDGKIDLLLSLPDDNCGFNQRLYLSSQAPEGALLSKAASFTGRFAACGC